MKAKLLIIAGLLTGMMANSQIISVPGNTIGTLVPLSVSFEGASGISGSWIGLYRAEAADGDYMTYQYINEAVDGVIVFDGREETGLFTFRLFRGGGYDKIATSPVFMIRQGMLPDISFNNNGIFRKESLAGYDEIWASAVRVMPDDRIVVAGNIRTGLSDPGGYPKNGFIAARFLANGNPDPDFGQNGFAAYLFPDLHLGAYIICAKEATALAVQADGKVVVGGIATFWDIGYVFQVVILVRFTEGGELDNTFGDKGMVVDNYKWPDEGPSYALDELRCIEIDYQGRIWCGGGSLLDRPYAPGRPFIGRYLPDGRPDNSFGGVGMITPVDSIFFRGYVESLIPPAPGGDGPLFAGVTQVSQFGQNFFLLYKVGDNGDFVQDFGYKGIAVEHRPGLINEQYVKSIGIGANGTLYQLGGNSYWSMWLSAKNPTDGSEVKAFGDNGITTYDPTYSIDVPAGMALTPDNRIAVGTSTMSYRWSISMFTAKGALQPDFGTSFYPVAENGSIVESFVAGIAMQSDGKYILVGGSRFPSTNTWDFMMLRFEDNPANFSGIPENTNMTCQLSQNYPNPFRGATTVNWTQSSFSHVKLVLLDITGRTVADLVDEEQPAGMHSYRLEQGTAGIPQLAPGSYFYRISIQPVGGGSETFISTLKMLVLPDGR